MAEPENLKEWVRQENEKAKQEIDKMGDEIVQKLSDKMHESTEYF